jgi:nitrite reductase (NO-forming)
MKTTPRFRTLLVILTTTMMLFACSSGADSDALSASVELQAEPSDITDVTFTLQTLVNDGRLAYIGIGGEIDGIINPDLIVQPGAVVRLILVNGDSMPHDLFLPDFGVKTAFVSKIGERTEVILKVGDMQPGTYVYYCTVPGHRQAGQEGKLIVKD